MMEAQTPGIKFSLTVCLLLFSTVFPAIAADTDNDGVDDAFDDCCFTPVGVAVDAHGRPIGDLDLDCDTDLADYEIFLSGFTGTMGSAEDRTCNPVAQTGCEPCEKCALVRDDVNPEQWHAYCRPEGSVQVDNACTSDEATGLDNCAAGLTCKQEICAEICTTAPDSCPGGMECNALQNIVGNPDVGFCKEYCNPLADQSNCSAGEACFINVIQQTSLCAPVLLTGTQGDDCEYINGCAEGYSCALLNSPIPTGLVCAFICDASQSGGPTCAEGPGATYTCIPINQFYLDAPDLPDAYGMCIDPEQWDEDGDSVLDFYDQCPDTPPATPVDEFGCPL